MKKVVLTESQLKKLVYETAKKVVSRMNEGRKPYPTDEYGYYKAPRWNDETLDFMEYDTEAEAEGIQEMIQKVQKELLSSYTQKKAQRISGLKYSEMSLRRFFREDANNHYYNALVYYLEPKSRETNEPTYICALKFTEMSPEEQLADVTKYVAESLKRDYTERYNRYKDEFDRQSKMRGIVDTDIDAFVQKHGEVNVESLTYVQLVELDRELKSIGVKGLYGDRDSYRGRWYYDDILRHLNNGQLKDLIAQVNAEIKARRESVPSYDIGYLNKFDPHYHTSQAEYDEWEELQALMKKYKHVNVGGTDNHRGDSATWGDLVDENGQLVCTYSYKVDSSG